MKGSTEFAIFVCFDHMMFAHKALQREDRLGSAPFPISFYFGDRDWMPKEGCKEILEFNKYCGTHSHIYIIPNSDHHLYFDNPEDFSF